MELWPSGQTDHGMPRNRAVEEVPLGRTQGGCQSGAGWGNPDYEATSGDWQYSLPVLAVQSLRTTLARGGDAGDRGPPRWRRLPAGLGWQSNHQDEPLRG